MPHTRFRTTVEIARVNISRFSVDQLLSRLAAKYTSDSYDVSRPTRAPDRGDAV
jgi:hypothetical protein